MNKIAIIIVCLSLGNNVLANESFTKEVKPFIEEYCIRCHGKEKQKGDRRYDSLQPDFKNEKSAILWRDILDQLQLEEMPPKKPLPQPAQRKKVIDWITNNFKKVRDQQAVSRNGTVMRRLSHQEYTNSLKDLFKLNLPNFDLTRGLTDDNILHGFDTDAKQLKATPYLFSKYLEIADRFIEKTLPTEKPQNKKSTFEGRSFQGSRDSIVVKKGKNWLHMDLIGKVPDASRATIKKGYSSADGFYKIKFTVQAVDKDKNWKDYRCPKPGTPWKLKILASNQDYGPLSKPNSSDYDLKTLIVGPEKKTFEFEVFLRKGFQPVFYWENGGGGRPNFRRVVKKATKKEYEQVTKEMGASNVYNTYYKGPRLRVYKVEMNGPYFKQWPPAPVAAVFGDNPPAKPDSEFIKKKLNSFASRAWRRPAKVNEMEPILSLINKTLDQEGYRAVAKGMKAIICSPSFLYHYQNKGKLDDYALASRLSFFLWGTSPDLELLKLAYRKQLTDPKVYNEQVTRMINDPRMNNMVKNFSYQWLHLKHAKEMPPDEQKFRYYYSMNIDKHMITETQEFLKTLIKKNMSIYNVLDSDFVVVNETLAKYYGLKGFKVKGNKFQMVKLPPDSLRGGLITQASVLTATSNGVDTSPIVRGVWLLENILGISPPPPPADVEPLEPDIRGTKSIKERLRAHREKESCNECHRKIDYLGMALENFDPIGKWRTHYDKKRKVKVNATSTAPDGSAIKSSQNLKKFLMTKKDQFARGLTSKLLAYGVGREMSYMERPEIEEIVKKLKNKNGFKDLLTKIVNSKVFLHK